METKIPEKVTVEMGLQAIEAYKELIVYADHAECSVEQAYPKSWKLFQMFGIERDKSDKPGNCEGSSK